MQAPSRYTAKLEEKRVFNDKYMQLDFELVAPNEMRFTAGQYVSIKVSPDGERRSYSICSSPAIMHGFQLLIDVEPQGLGSRYLQNLELGQEIELLGPLGRFVVQDDLMLAPGAFDVSAPQPSVAERAVAEPPIVFVATGSGIAPFRSMVLDLLQEKKTTRKIILHWGMRFVEQLFWEDEFAELMESFPHFSFHPVISKPLAGWSLCSGRVTDCLRVHEQPEQAQYYLCGNAEMVTGVFEVLMSKGVDPADIYHEKFY